MGKGGRQNPTSVQKAAAGELTKKTTEKITWSEVKKHTSPEDAWIVYNNKVYDVSNW